MARPLRNLSKSMQILHFQSQHIMTFFVALTTVVSLVSIISFLCASHTGKKSHTEIEEETSTGTTSGTSACRSDKKLLKKLNSSISSKTHNLIVKMTSWKKLREVEGDGYEDEDEDNSDEAIWRRGIIMGERCRPLEFSGKILYDCDGNLLPSDSLKRNQSGIST